MSIELRLNEKFDVLVDEFENHMVDAKNVALEAQQLFFRAVEELEDKFSNGVRGVCSDMIDRYLREELAEDFLTDEAMTLVRQLFLFSNLFASSVCCVKMQSYRCVVILLHFSSPSPLSSILFYPSPCLSPLHLLFLTLLILPHFS
jgi:hypothetical protein